MKKWYESCSLDYCSMYIQILIHTQNIREQRTFKKKIIVWAFSEFGQNWKVTQHACFMFHVRCSHHANFIADIWKIIWQRIGANIWQTFNVSDESALHSTKLEPSRAKPSWIAAINAFYVFHRCLANCLIIQQICSSLSYVDHCWLWNIVYNMYLFASKRFNDYAFA